LLGRVAVSDPTLALLGQVICDVGQQAALKVIGLLEPSYGLPAARGTQRATKVTLCLPSRYPEVKILTP